MQYDVITLFPQMIENYCNQSILSRGAKNGVISINTHNPREFGIGKHKRVDDTPYGGGDGMVLMCGPIFDSYNNIPKLKNTQTILLTPQGQPFCQKKAEKLASFKQLILICGHYEGFDERIRTNLCQNIEEISIGDFVLTGGELGALCIIDATSRYLEGVLGKTNCAHEDSFEDGLLEYPQYTKPADYKGLKVPEVLLSGNHKLIEQWRYEQKLERTKNRRPDLIN